MSSIGTNQNSMTLLSDQWYKHIRRSAQLWIPALITFYTAVSGIFGLSHTVEVLGVLGALNVLAGGGTALAKKVYEVTGVKYDGDIRVRWTAEGAKTAGFNFYTPLTDLVDQKGELSFRVVIEGAPPVFPDEPPPAQETSAVVEETPE